MIDVHNKLSNVKNVDQRDVIVLHLLDSVQVHVQNNRVYYTCYCSLLSMCSAAYYMMEADIPLIQYDITRLLPVPSDVNKCVFFLPLNFSRTIKNNCVTNSMCSAACVLAGG